jgi:Uma2 family endonuclease
MNQPYQEMLSGQLLVRHAPGVRHERICARLHEILAASIANFPGTQLLPIRTPIELKPDTRLCPDIGLIATRTGRLWLAAEVVDSSDHRPDTVFKKQFYEEWRLPRLWMIDPRYDNVEVYHGTEYGLQLKHILANHETLNEQLLPEFEVTVRHLFGD